MVDNGVVTKANEEHYSDRLADITVYSRVDDALGKLVKEYQSQSK